MKKRTHSSGSSFGKIRLAGNGSAEIGGGKWGGKWVSLICAIYLRNLPCRNQQDCPSFPQTIPLLSPFQS